MLNSYEQQLIGIASGTFEYEGELYKVQSSYLSMLEAKLNQEGVDLSAEQANQAISKIFSNVEEGVKQNILQKVQGEAEQKEARKKGNIRKTDEIEITEKDSLKDEEKTEEIPKEDSVEESEQIEMITGKDGNPYPVQTTPIDTTRLSGFDYEATVVSQNYTTDEQVVSQLSAQKMQVFSVLAVVWLVGVIAVGIYLKVFKHRAKALFVLLGAGLASLSILVIGSIFLYCGRAYSVEAWHTAALESGYFKECSRQAIGGIEETLSDVGVEADVSVFGFTEQVVYRDAKTIFSSRIAGKGMPVLKKRTESVRGILQKLLPKESVEDVDSLSETIMQHYTNTLDTPYASYLYQLKKEHVVKSTLTVIAAMITLMGAIVLIWKGSRYTHRRFRGIAYGFGIAGCAFMIAGGWQMGKMPQITLQPLVYQLLFEQYVNWLDKNVLCMGILLSGLSLFTWCASYVTKKNHIQKIRFE